MSYASRRRLALVLAGLLACCTVVLLRPSAATEAASTAGASQHRSAGSAADAFALPKHFLTGYWHNFVNDAGALRLGDTPEEYDVVAVAFGGQNGQINVADSMAAANFADSNSGTMLGCDGRVYGQGSVDFLTALVCIQVENGLRPDQVALGLPAGPGAAGGGIVGPSVGAMTWSINWDVANGGDFAGTVGPHLDTLP